MSIIYKVSSYIKKEREKCLALRGQEINSWKLAYQIKIYLLALSTCKSVTNCLCRHQHRMQHATHCTKYENWNLHVRSNHTYRLNSFSRFPCWVKVESSLDSLLNFRSTGKWFLIKVIKNCRVWRRTFIVRLRKCNIKFFFTATSTFKSMKRTLICQKRYYNKTRAK